MKFQTHIDDYKAPQISKAWIEELYRLNWLKLFVPKSLGGRQADLVDGLNTMMQAGSINGSLGWLVNLGAGAGYFCGFFEKNTATAIFESPKVYLAGSGMLGGTAKIEQDRFRISGSWTHCTGAAHATHFTLNAQLPDNKGVRSFLIPAGALEVHPEWHAFGLKPTASYKVTGEDIFLPTSYAFDIGVVRSFVDYPIYHLPFEVFARFCMGAAFLGMVDGFLQKCLEAQSLAKIAPQVEKAAENLQQPVSQLLDLASAFYATVQSKQALSAKQTEELTQLVGGFGRQYFDLLNEIYYEGGMTFSDTRQEVHWAYRDLMTAVHHFFLKKG